MISAGVHTPAELARYYQHPEVKALRAAVRATDPKDRPAYKAALNAIRDKVSELKARDA